MYIRTFFTMICLVLTGCQSAKVIEQNSAPNTQVVHSISELQSVKMTLPSTKSVKITPQSQILDNSTINSPVAVFEFPSNRGELNITITSQIEDSVFYPSAIIVDKSGKVIERYQGDNFKYLKPRLAKGNRISANINFFPPMNEDTLYLVVYTNEDEQNKTTTVINPARLFAEAHGNYLPQVKDIPVPHAKVGVISVEIDGARANLLQSTNTMTSSAPAASQKASTERAKQYYYAQIKQAVNSDDIPRALQLLDEAKAKNISGAQDVFVNAINNK
ncbi:MalM family protein [Vibrio marisflavi]|uniref:Maltose operon periplasmic protein n=1 Tax=Vibrio marisflavi CECT 7928 TaxID=634439 RepID=A0ABN8E1G8_9VIBR|nr:MalM family protein [Vibrio marisflavi]CAH0537039.1 hypothetical protein VMF7928_00876 [Vibrio marisflavi CECT 7928]